MNSTPLIANKLELHYFFNDDTHTIDALTRNKCETEILKIIKEVAIQLNVEINVETEAYLEGGLIDRWKLVDAKTIATASLLVTIVMGVLSRFPVSTVNPELEQLQIKIAKKTLENLEKADEEKAEVIDESEITKIEPIEIEKAESKNDVLKVEQVIDRLDTNIKITRFKSNFYSFLSNYKKITQISTTPLSDNNEPVEPPKTILREQFSDFIIESDELEPNVVEDASIEIISPVLKKGKYKWKGIYLGESVDFYMKDQDFKELIYGKKISFQTGICIECVLEIQRRIDELGIIQITNRSVLTVLNYTEGTSKIETKRGRARKDLKNQSSLDFPEDK